MGRLPNLVGFRLRMAQVMVFKDFEEALAGLDITPAIFGVLEILSQNKGLTQTRLAVAIGLDRSSLVPLLDKLQTRQLVARAQSTEDRRSNNLHLSPQGEQLLEEAARRIALHEQRILSSLSKSEARQLIALLQKVGRSRE
jgi:DNA-binding MarR family transcriptional regulator